MSDDNNDDDANDPNNKNNTGKNHKPQNVKNQSPSPFGTVSVKGSREVTITVTNEEMPDRIERVNLDRSDITLEEPILGLNVLLRLDPDGPSSHGIEGGRITRMTLTDGQFPNERILAHFDHGTWIQKPQKPLEIQVQMRAQKEHNGLEMPEVKPAFDHAQKNKLKP